DRNRNLITNDEILAVSGKISFKDESDAEILAEDIVTIERISDLSNRSSGNGYGNSNGNGYGYNGNGNGYSNGNGNYDRGPENGTAVRQSAPPANPVKLRISEEVVASHGDNKGVLMHITDMISLYPGDRDVLVYLPEGRKVRVNADSRVTFTDELKEKLVRMLGAENVKG
ncbi:MAG: hypothetical protein IJH57_03400, partial [Mogibacterium sp.]|nr:hypothetical protein [Mogibacterium sp.]